MNIVVIVYGELWILDQLIFRGAFTPRKAATKLREMLLHNARLPQREVDARMTRWSETSAP